MPYSPENIRSTLGELKKELNEAELHDLALLILADMGYKTKKIALKLYRQPTKTGKHHL